MSFTWLKRYMPRGLQGRALLILILPVATLQIVVSVVFIQRHFEGVTEDMTAAVAREITVVRAREDAQLARALEFRIRPAVRADVPAVPQIRWFDFSGRVVIREMEQRLSDLEGLALPDDDDVMAWFEDDGALREFRFSRDRVSPSNPHQLLVNMVVFGALMTFISYLYLRNQLRPITRLADAAEAFGRGRQMPYTPSGAVEVRAAGNAFVDMRNRIERQIEQRTMMLSGVSHDLRTPLTRMKLALSMLDDADRLALEGDVEDMQRMIDAFLDFARGDAEGGTAVAIDPVTLVEGIVARAAESGQPVRLAAIEGSGHVTLRPGALTRAIDNLINNAVRYGSDCAVSVALTERALRIRVEDDGPGIPVEARDEAMRPFVRLDAARNQNRGSGVGLGLAIAADIARAHGGVLRLGESAAMGGLAADIVIAR